MKLNQIPAGNRFRFTAKGAHACSFDREEVISTRDVYLLVRIVPNMEYLKSGGHGEPAQKRTEFVVQRLGKNTDSIVLIDAYDVEAVER